MGGRANRCWGAAAWATEIVLAATIATTQARGEITVSTSAPIAGTTFKSSFAKPPADALKHLKAAVGKEFSSGWVFIDGRYVPPPYKVERWGNAIRINKIQVTKELVPWSDFLKTQKGVKVTKTVASASEPVAEESEEEEEEEEPVVTATVDDGEASLDDLFDDEPAPVATTPKKIHPKKKRKNSAPHKQCVAKTSYELEGDFVPNAKTAEYIKKINDYRTKIDMHLRQGGYCFFGSGYHPFMGDSSSSKLVIAKLPDIMRRNSEFESFSVALRTAGIPFTGKIVNDIFKGRIYYPQIQKRLKEKEASSSSFPY